MMQKHGQLLFLASGLFLASIFFAYTHHSGNWLIPTDTYYYIALSDSLIENQELLDVTSIPPGPLLTYQNGIPFVYAFLKTLGLTNFTAMKVVSFFNFFCWISACYPFLKLIQYFGITYIWAQGLLLLGFFSSSSLLNYQLTPGTDGLFNCAAIWLVYLLISIYKKNSKDLVGTKIATFTMIFSVFIISIIIVHFSIRILLYELAFIASVLLCKHDDKLKIFNLSFLLFAATVISLVTPYLIFKPLMPEEISQSYKFMIMDREEPIRIMLSQYLGIGSFLNSFNGYILFVTFLIFLLYTAVRTKIKNEFGPVFISLTILICISGNLLLNNGTMIQAGARYMISTLPLFCLLLALFKYSRPIAYLTIAAFSTVTILTLMSPNRPYCITTFWTSFYNKNIALPENAILLTDRGRYGYVFLNGRNYNMPLSSLKSSHNKIWLAGSVHFINENLKNIKENEFVTVKNVNILHSDNLPRCTSALVQCDINVIDAGHQCCLIVSSTVKAAEKR
jgi:hypothetical protein